MSGRPFPCSTRNGVGTGQSLKRTELGCTDVDNIQNGRRSHMRFIVEEAIELEIDYLHTKREYNRAANEMSQLAKRTRHLIV